MIANGIAFSLSKATVRAFMRAWLNSTNRSTRWSKAGNPASEFEQLGPRILLVLDNASYHKKQAILDHIAAPCPSSALLSTPV
jgi:hypothetical protein